MESRDITTVNREKHERRPDPQPIARISLAEESEGGMVSCQAKGIAWLCGENHHRAEHRRHRVGTSNTVYKTTFANVNLAYVCFGDRVQGAEQLGRLWFRVGSCEDDRIAVLVGEFPAGYQSHDCRHGGLASQEAKAYVVFIQ